MSIIRVSIFQKELGNPLGRSIAKAFTRLKSDFLLLPEFFYTDDETRGYDDLDVKSKGAEDWLTDVSELYKGTIIGGAYFRTSYKEKKKYLSIPIVVDGEIVDHYDKKNLNTMEKKYASPGKDYGTFVLNGIFFAAISYVDLQKKEQVEFLAKQGIQLIFTQANFEIGFDKQNVQEYLVEVGMKYNVTIILCCGVGNFLTDSNGIKKLSGYSLVVTPFGISWQIHNNETNKEILKTIVVSHKLTS